MTRIDRGWIQILADVRAEAFWVRIFGYGFRIGSRRLHVVLFSERSGFRKVHYIGPVVFEVLRPRKWGGGLE